MQRFNMFYQIHKGLRILMYDTATLLSQTDFTDPEQAETATERIGRVMDMFDKHADTEDTMVLPLLEQYEFMVVNAFEQEHVADHALGQKLRGFLLAFSHTISSDAKIQLGASLTNAFIEFMIFNLQHMAKEETVLNNLLWKYYSDIELFVTHKKIVSSVPADHSAFASKWMMKALNNNEIVEWMRNVERNAPAPAFRNLLNTAEKELDDVRFKKVLTGLSEGIMVAS